MKRKISLTLVLILSLVLVFAGCKKGAVTPSPALTVKPATTATIQPSASPTSTAPMTSPGTTAGAITGFEEGKTVDVKTIPDVEKAVLAKYAGATIKSVTFATYMNQQAYKVMLSGATDGTTEAYVDATGKVLSTPNTSSPGPTK